MKKALAVLKAGGVIAFPTDTVFGIGALLSKPKAIRKIYKIKKRPLSKPLQVLIASFEQARELGEFSEKAWQFAKKVWPGPYTLVVYKTRKVPELITGGTNKVGLRIPAHRTLLKLIRTVGPIVATSANQAGEKPALTTREVLVKVDYALPGKVKSGRASKVIDVSRGFKTLRA